MNSPCYDIIGDIHGHADMLERLLGALGYHRMDGSHRHPDGRQVIFLGDYLDRGPKIPETLRVVREMVESGSAQAIIGNHELNAILYHTADGKGGFLRPHSEKNQHQHAATLEQLADPNPEAWQDWLAWLKTLPLYLDLEGIRAVHAAWHPDVVAAVEGLDLTDDATLQQLANKSEGIGAAVDALTAGPEIHLPDGLAFGDRYGQPRTAARFGWWREWHADGAHMLREVVFPDNPDLPDRVIPGDLIPSGWTYPRTAKPVFFGHYWLPPASDRQPLASNVACLDYSVAKGGPLVAYRWNGESELMAEKFVKIRPK